MDKSVSHRKNTHKMRRVVCAGIVLELGVLQFVPSGGGARLLAAVIRGHIKWCRSGLLAVVSF